MSLTDPNTTTKYGTYEVKTGDDTIKIKFDQKNQTPGNFDYTAVLLFVGEMKVTFTPDAAFTGTPVAKFKIASEKTLVSDDGVSSDVKYAEKDVFTKYDTTEQELVFTKDNSTGVWTATIPASALANLIEINTIVLDTKNEYDAFQQVLSAMGKVGIEVIDKTLPVA